MIEITDLCNPFGAVEVLKGISLRVERGGVVAVIGPSGSGKSTLLRCINLLETPDRGAIRVGDHRMEFSGGRRVRRATASWRRSAPPPAWCSSTSTCSRI